MYKEIVFFWCCGKTNFSLKPITLYVLFSGFTTSIWISPSRREGPTHKGEHGLIFSIAHPSGNLFSWKGRCPFVPIDVVSHLASTNVGVGEPQQTAHSPTSSPSAVLGRGYWGGSLCLRCADPHRLGGAGEKHMSPGLLRLCYCHRAQHALKPWPPLHKGQ